MNITEMSGFTASLSLYINGGPYRIFANRKSGYEPAAVQPAIFNEAVAKAQQMI